ncbi:MAG: N-acetylmuramoyl-L-alanine amidase [Pseudomonadaceae bacterium]|nr:N-acetylmuramoyl-L-alanine amidase [Pseudomonadaceae bacterium]
MIHFTESWDDTHALQVLKNPRPDNPKASVSCHYLVHRDGRIRILVPENRRAWHTGKSAWGTYGESDPEDGINRLNVDCMGIEVENRGDRMKDGAFQPLANLEPLTGHTLERVVALVKDICHRHHIPPENVIPHDAAAIPPGRKQDPGRGVAALWARLVEEGVALPRCPFVPFRITPEEAKEKRLLGTWNWEKERLER